MLLASSPGSGEPLPFDACPRPGPAAAAAGRGEDLPADPATHQPADGTPDSAPVTHALPGRGSRLRFCMGQIYGCSAISQTNTVRV